MKDLADELAESREYIQYHGWTRQDLRDSGGVCSLGGILFSQGWVIDVVDDNGKPCKGMDPERKKDAVRVAGAVVDALELDWTLTDYLTMLTHWNDEFAYDKQEVLDAFMKAEKTARDGSVKS